MDSSALPPRIGDGQGRWKQVCAGSSQARCWVTKSRGRGCQGRGRAGGLGDATGQSRDPTKSKANQGLSGRLIPLLGTWFATNWLPVHPSPPPAAAKF